MKSNEVIEVLSNWFDLVSEYSGIIVDFDAPDDSASKNLTRRQRIIEKLQSLDAQLREIRKIVAGGCAGFEQDSIHSINVIREKGNSLLAQCNERDSQVLEKAKESRVSVSGKLSSLRLSKNYLPSNLLTKRRPPVIVDNRF